MRTNFKHSSEVYEYVSTSSDAWINPMIEAYLEGADLEEGDDFDPAELNEWLEEEISSIQQGYESFLDEGEE
jgi:hypothetical protein|tara:strand:- start:154 stop:369 length:216 start_codon:yes stop_codon:yes gene_type:complete